MLHELLNALEETLFMVFTAGLLTWMIGLPLGTFISLTKATQLLPNPLLHALFNRLLTTLRSVPFLILMICVIPLTRFLTGTLEGTLAAVVPLTLAAIPTFTKLTEDSINEVPLGLIEAARAVGANTFQIVYKVLIPEALPGIINALITTLIHLVGYSVIAGALGSGGLGSLAIEKGYTSFQLSYVLATAALLIGLTEIIQFCGKYVNGGIKLH